MPIRWRVGDVLDARGMSQSALAEAAGVARATVNRMVNQQTTAVDLAVLERIADALDVDATMLIHHERKAKRGRG